jgi:hypothetical protein
MLDCSFSVAAAVAAGCGVVTFELVSPLGRRHLCHSSAVMQATSQPHLLSRFTKSKSTN